MASYYGIVRRMVSLPRSIFGGFSRAMGGGSRRSPTLLHEYSQQQQEMDFVASFEHQYGFTHPCFYTCHFMEALEIAKEENKFLFMYLQHPFTPSFCRENTLFRADS
uniref:Uncharacterized protein n=1 Tax=Cannabis sativa TaxID=3483 RepID=A0A803P997_CANSA